MDRSPRPPRPASGVSLLLPYPRASWKSRRSNGCEGKHTSPNSPPDLPTSLPRLTTLNYFPTSLPRLTRSAQELKEASPAFVDFLQHQQSAAGEALVPCDGAIERFGGGAFRQCQDRSPAAVDPASQPDVIIGLAGLWTDGSDMLDCGILQCGLSIAKCGPSRRIGRPRSGPLMLPILSLRVARAILSLRGRVSPCPIRWGGLQSCFARPLSLPLPRRRHCIGVSEREVGACAKVKALLLASCQCALL